MNEKGWKIIVSCTPFALKSVLSTFYYVMFVVFVVLSSISSGFLGRAGFLISLSKSVFSCMVLQDGAIHKLDRTTVFHRAVSESTRQFQSANHKINRLWFVFFLNSIPVHNTIHYFEAQYKCRSFSFLVFSSEGQSCHCLISF